MNQNSRWSDYENNSPYAEHQQQQNHGDHLMPSSPFGTSYNQSHDSFASADVPLNNPTEKMSGQAAYDPSSWLNAQKESEKKSKRTVIITAAVALIILIIGGAVAGAVVATRHHSNKSSDSDGSSPNSSSKHGGATGVVDSDPDDPSKFEKDPRLHQSFYGFAYTPFNAQTPWCGAVQANVTEDIQLLSQLTTRIRTYGSDCNASILIMEAIKETKVDMKVWLGVWVDSNDTTWERQRDDTVAVIKQYGTDNIAGITVGNEYILNNSPSETASPDAIKFILDKVADFQKALGTLNLPNPLPIGTADAGSMITTELAQSLDFVMANVHGFFGGVPVDQAAGWTWDFFQENDVAAVTATNKSPLPQVYIAETGWPTQSLTPDNATLGGAEAGIPQLQTFLDTFVCAANGNSTQYFFFEAFDEPWKVQFGGVEPFWGLFDANKILKKITIPGC